MKIENFQVKELDPNTTELCAVCKLPFEKGDDVLITIIEDSEGKYQHIVHIDCPSVH